jgi:hypothetical protein
LRIGLAAGYRLVDDVVRWADEVLALDPGAPAVLSEISLAGQQDPSTAAELLAAIPGKADVIQAARLVLAQLRDDLRTGRYPPESIAKLVCNLAAAGYLPEDPFGLEPWSLEDSFDLAKAGIYGSYQDATTRLDQYLVTYAAGPAA